MSATGGKTSQTTLIWRTKHLHLTPPQLLVAGFASVILFGALLLYLPGATASGQRTDFLTALFTATSAVCVTGLVVVDTGTHWSAFGQAVILLLIQVGGLGFMTMATLFFLLLGWRIGLRERLLLQESLNQINVAGVVRLVRVLLIFTFFSEGLFTLILSSRWFSDYGWPRCLWMGLFHAVSAFNNAGFDIFGGFRSLTAYVNDPVVVFSITTLIILGGLGFSVILDMGKYLRFHGFPRSLQGHPLEMKNEHLSVHSRLVLLITAMLILTGFFFFTLLEWGNVLRPLSLSGKLLAAYFQAITPRTAGFNTLEISHLLPATQFLLIIFMFIGASPGSTGGGIKTTTFGLLGLALFSLARGKEDVEVFHRRIPASQVYKAISILLLAVGLIASITLLLNITERADFLTILFETVSAFGTVGLSMGLTPHLSDTGRIAIILTMFLGRLGPLTLAFALAQRKRKLSVRFPEEKIIIG